MIANFDGFPATAAMPREYVPLKKGLQKGAS
jgi:hypothetical protein